MLSDSVVQCIECCVIDTEVRSSCPTINWGGREEIYPTYLYLTYTLKHCTHVYVIIFFYSVVLKENVRGYTVVFSQMSSNKTKGVTQ